MHKILLFIPFYNCEKQIIRVLKQCEAFQHKFTEIILIDNRSSDKGPEIAKTYLQESGFKAVKILKNIANYSLGGSHKVAFQYALENNFDFVIVLHGDDQGQLADLMTLVEKKRHLSYDCLLGARFHQESRLQGYSKFRTLGNIILNLLCCIPCRLKVLDMGSGLNMYSLSFIQDTRIHAFPDDLTFNVYLLFHACFNKKKIHYFPLVWREEDQISNAKVFHQFLHISKMIVGSLRDRSYIYQKRSDRKYSYEVYYQKVL